VSKGWSLFQKNPGGNLIRTNKRKAILLIIFILMTYLCVSILTGCSKNSNPGYNQTNESTGLANSNLKFANNSLVLTGSTTLLEVSQMWAEEFMKINDGKITY
jgi:ABC-type phosphate transport system substrate-binding protein